MSAETQITEPAVYRPWLSRDERRGALITALLDHPEWSDRRIAYELNVSREMVARARARMVATGQIASGPGRMGRDGKAYKKLPVRTKPMTSSVQSIARRIRAITTKLLDEETAAIYRTSSPGDRGLLDAAAIQLAAKAGELRRRAHHRSTAV